MNLYFGAAKMKPNPFLSVPIWGALRLSHGSSKALAFVGADAHIGPPASGGEAIHQPRL